MAEASPATRVDVDAARRAVDASSDSRWQGSAVWFPLERAVPGAWLVGFMWMGSRRRGGGDVHCYKHGITRKSLWLDEVGGAYREFADGSLIPTDAVEAVLNVFESPGLPPVAKDAPYSPDVVAARCRRLRELGFQVVL